MIHLLIFRLLLVLNGGSRWLTPMIQWLKLLVIGEYCCLYLYCFSVCLPWDFSQSSFPQGICTSYMAVQTIPRDQHGNGKAVYNLASDCILTLPLGIFWLYKASPNKYWEVWLIGHHWRLAISVCLLDPSDPHPSQMQNILVPTQAPKSLIPLYQLKCCWAQDLVNVQMSFLGYIFKTTVSINLKSHETKRQVIFNPKI